MQSLPQENFQEPEEDLEYLALQIVQFPTKSLALLLQLFAKELLQHAKKDRLRGRPLRSISLHSASEYLSTSGKYLASSVGEAVSATSAGEMASATSVVSSALSSAAREISLQEIRYRAYTLSRMRYGKIVEFFTGLEKKMQEQRQYIVAGHLSEARDRILIAEKISPPEQRG